MAIFSSYEKASDKAMVRIEFVKKNIVLQDEDFNEFKSSLARLTNRQNPLTFIEDFNALITGYENHCCGLKQLFEYRYPFTEFISKHFYQSYHKQRITTIIEALSDALKDNVAQSNVLIIKGIDKELNSWSEILVSNNSSIKEYKHSSITRSGRAKLSLNKDWLIFSRTFIRQQERLVLRIHKERDIDKKIAIFSELDDKIQAELGRIGAERNKIRISTSGSSTSSVRNSSASTEATINNTVGVKVWSDYKARNVPQPLVKTKFDAFLEYATGLQQARVNISALRASRNTSIQYLDNARNNITDLLAS
ncbi:MAG: hypothetical protein QG673_629 [Pseudomonadota bacterium]|nr:hypothetical protein [Pseudomonadota bacterium]